MTIHSAKGLEFRVVFIVGVEEGLLPSVMSQGSNRELEEERRLLYVAITRAKEYCILTSSRERFMYGETKNNIQPSRFLKEIDSAYIRMAGGTAPQQQFTTRTQQPQGTPSFALTNRVRTQAPAPQEPRRIVPPKLQRITTPGVQTSGNNTAKAPLNIGQIIEHNRFGIGEVINVEGSGINAKATIKFQNVGTKVLILSYATYKIIR